MFTKQCQRFRFLLVAFTVIAGVMAGHRDTQPLPEDRGTAGALAALEKLPVFVRVLHTTAHPDDESAGTLTWLSRKFHARTALFCLTRGEGGQNILGQEKYTALGVLRTGELLQAARHYGVEVYFGTVVDFGFSKTAGETLEKWGHTETLREMVHFIRRWRPTVILSQFQGEGGDGHGHHQAAGILTREAFRAAGDPTMFPEQIQAGLHPWQSRKLYVRLRHSQDANDGIGYQDAVLVPVGEYNPVLGRSYREIGSEGYGKHRTQGNAASFAFPGPACEGYRLMESIIDTTRREHSFFDSIDTSLKAIWDLAGEEKANVPFLAKDLEQIEKTALDALSRFDANHPERSIGAISRGTQTLRGSIERVREAGLSKKAREILEEALEEKLRDFQHAARAALGIRLFAIAGEATAVPGEEVQVTVSFHNQGKENVTLNGVTAGSAPGIGRVAIPHACLNPTLLPAGESASCRISLLVSPRAPLTQPFWRLASPNDARYTHGPSADPFAPFSPPELTLVARYVAQGTEFPIEAALSSLREDPTQGPEFVDFQVVPELSLSLRPEILIQPAGAARKTDELHVTVLNNRKEGTRGKVRLVVPDGWQVEPREVSFSLSRKGETLTHTFHARMPPNPKRGRHTIQAEAEAGGQTFRDGYVVLSHPGNWTRNIYSPAQSRVEVFDIKVAPDLRVGYIPGTGDEIPESLQRLGLRPVVLSGEDLASGGLGRFSAIITGIRAYNVNEALKAYNHRLLDYVAQGGTLIVQYVRPMENTAAGEAGSLFPFGPYPMRVSGSERITVEDSPVRILVPDHPVFTVPNKIGEDDFKDWVQERGLYFMSSWDERYKPLLSGNDPGEPPKNGGFLYARYGKGHYIYTGYSFFRQLPAGNPGAFRILANMISLGRTGRRL